MSTKHYKAVVTFHNPAGTFTEGEVYTQAALEKGDSIESLLYGGRIVEAKPEKVEKASPEIEQALAGALGGSLEDASTDPPEHEPDVVTHLIEGAPTKAKK